MIYFLKIYLVIICLPILSALELPATELKRDIFRTSFSFHIAEMDSNGKPAGTFIFDARKPTQMILAPKIKGEPGVLRGSVFDVAENMRAYGFQMPPGSLALYSPSAELFYIRSTSSDLEMVDLFMLHEPYGRSIYTFDLRVTARTARGATSTILKAESVGFTTGSRTSLNVSGERGFEIGLEPNFNPDDMSYQLDSSVTFRVKNKSVTLNHSFFEAPLLKPQKMTLGKIADTTFAMEFQIHRTIEEGPFYWLLSAGAKADAMERIEIDLKHNAAK